MKWLTFFKDGMERVGVLSGDDRTVFPLSVFGFEHSDMNEVIRRLTTAEQTAVAEQMQTMDPSRGFLLAEVRLCAPIPEPLQDVVCLGINYMAHADEAEKYSSEAFATQHQNPIVFSKRVHRAVADGEAIDGHFDLVDRLDYEAELAVVIGRDARNVRREDAGDHVFGYTILNDVSARNLQTAHKQWYFGKSLDGFTPMGPWIVGADAFSFPPRLQVRCAVNGELRQDGNTSLQIFPIDRIIEILSAGMTLRAGTIIATGTPAGVGMGFDPPKFLKAGDVVVCEIEGIGKLTNPVR